MGYNDTQQHNVGNTTGFFNTEHAAGFIVLGSLVALILIRRGFRGVSVAGVSVGIR